MKGKVSSEPRTPGLSEILHEPTRVVRRMNRGRTNPPEADAPAVSSVVEDDPELVIELGGDDDDDEVAIEIQDDDESPQGSYAA